MVLLLVAQLLTGGLAEQHMCPLSPDSGEPGADSYLLVDSGAGLPACPQTHPACNPLSHKEGDARGARTADGTKVKFLGFRTVGYELGDRRKGKITFQVMNVEKPVLSVGHLTETGFEVHLKTDPYIHKGKRRLPLLKPNNVY